ncbi:hypothetical protein F3B42_18145 [Bacteroides ovatus]|uniref:Lipoprotein n=1 Tax=Bacteroides ovatus TaxID=28116 RepID=A0A7J4XUI7_BACOV|nr:hypothetical protein F3B90_18155 [Bacteroides ovatus]KAA4636043.1 hypothetical protein F3B52_18465 [Bacteroides ovatus]KAA4670369.1 hypothetical protein F3B42_18145 [Bacteroides ovatus]KAA4679858.1 hypothetical protein F3B41_17875 [Bacteroides ovatus]
MRKWTYLVATLLMAGTTATFTGCIDTDEPEGIAELRGAKSEFIKAQAAVELVEAELRKAQVAEQELVNAGLALQNKSAEIDLQLHELDIQLKQLLIEKEEAATAQAKAEAEAAIAKAEADKTKWENEKALIVEQYKEKMLLAETATAKAQEAYKQAMEQIEASKLLLTDEEQARLNGVQAQVAYAKQAMDKAMYGYSTTVIKRILSSEVANSTTTTNPDESTETNSSTTKYYVYLITEDPTQSADGYKAGSLKKLQEQLANYSDIVADNNLEAVLDNALKNAEFALEMTQKYADNLKAILDNEYTTVADWEAEVKKLEEEIAAAKVKEQQYNIEKGKLEVANPKLISDLQATSNKLEIAKNNQNSNKNKAKTAAAYSKRVEAEIKKGLNDVIPSGTTVAGYNSSTGTFAYGKDILITEAQNQIDGWIKLIDKATKGVDLENIEWAKPQLATALAAQKEAEENYAKDYKAWEDAMAAYDESLKIDLEKSEAAANAAIKKYNGLKPEDRKKEANIDAVATALVAYYKDALAKEAQVTKATATKGSDTKKISAWLIADADNFKKVVGVDLGFITWDAGDIATANEISKENIGKLIDVEQDSSVKTPLEKWKSASSAVFSDNFNSGNNPRRLPVSKDEVIAAAGGNHVDALKNGNYGSLGKMIWATAETASLQAIIDQVETYKALKEAFTAQKAVEQTTQDKANAALADAVDKAKKANDEAQAAYDKVFKEVNDNIATVQKEYGNNEIIKGKIETEITVYLNNNFTNGDLGSLEAIKNLVKEEYMIALANVTAAKADVAKAKRNIEKLAAGTYTDTDYITESLVSIQEKIKVKQAEYDAAKADYDTASAQLKALLAIFLK